MPTGTPVEMCGTKSLRSVPGGISAVIREFTGLNLKWLDDPPHDKSMRRDCSFEPFVTETRSNQYPCHGSPAASANGRRCFTRTSLPESSACGCSSATAASDTTAAPIQTTHDFFIVLNL